MSEERVKEGLEHLQKAALELIAAARALLDAAEEAVKDPADVLAVVNHLAATGRAATKPNRPAPDGDADEPDHVERIRVV